MNQSTAGLCTVVLFAACICATAGHVIVYPRILESRSQEGTKVLKINDDITLNLRSSSVFPEEFLIHTTEDGAPIAYHMLGADTENNLYEDSEHMAAVHVSEEDGVMVEGVIGHTLRIKPLEGSERSSGGDIAHELYSISYPDAEKHLSNDYSIPNTSIPEPVVESRDIKWYTGPRLPVSITPEVHVVVDHFISKALNFVHKKIARYVAVLAASANLRYRSIIQPRVQLKIVGVSVTKTPQEEPYMVHVPGYEATRNILNDETRYKFKDYVLKQPYFKTADIVFLLTGLNLSEWQDNTLQHWIGGSAFLGGVCKEWKVGLSEERPGSYYGVYVFAHEIAHSLGCEHDGEGPYQNLWGHIGSKDCPWSDGYIMSYAFKTPFLYQFSRCCQREIMNAYNRPEYKCLIQKNSLTTGIYSTKLPGDVSSRQVYCAQVYNQYAYVQADKSYSAKTCLVRCFINRNGDNMLIAAVDGLACDTGKVCILGNCTSRAELKKAE